MLISGAIWVTIRIKKEKKFFHGVGHRVTNRRRG